MLYDIHTINTVYNDKKMREVKHVIEETIRCALYDMQVFGSISQLTESGYYNLPILRSQLTYKNCPVRFIMCSIDKRYFVTSIYVITESY